jgi:glycosyltransferase involved in cell wall biosynthesis
MAVIYLLPTENHLPLDVIVRTKNSEELLEACLHSICNEIPAGKILIIDGGSTDKTLEIAYGFKRASVYIKPELNLGQATKYGFLMAETEWVAIIDSDIILRKGWFEDMKKYMVDSDAVEGCRIDHYRFDTRVDCTRLSYARFGQTILKREPVLSMDIDVPFGEDLIIKKNFDRQGKRWKKVLNYLADHYTKIEGSTQPRTGIVFKPQPDIMYIPKKIQIQQGRLARKYQTIAKKQVIKMTILAPVYEAYWAFKRNFWFLLAYFHLI